MAIRRFGLITSGIEEKTVSSDIYSTVTDMTRKLQKSGISVSKTYGRPDIGYVPTTFELSSSILSEPDIDKSFESARIIFLPQFHYSPINNLNEAASLRELNRSKLYKESSQSQ